MTIKPFDEIANKTAEDGVDTDLFERVKAVLIKEQTVSISLLQRRLLLGYSQALVLMTELELAGVVTALNAESTRALTAGYVHKVDQIDNDAPGWVLSL